MSTLSHNDEVKMECVKNIIIQAQIIVPDCNDDLNRITTLLEVAVLIASEIERN